MRTILLMSAPDEEGVREIFPPLLKLRRASARFAYLPVDGASTPERFVNEWRGYAERYGAEFVYINSSKKNSKVEQEKLLSCNICFVSGGNTFLLLRNLRRSGLDEALKRFVEKDEFVLVGASAGALVLTPTIEVCNIPGFDKNQVGLKDLAGLGLVDFEVWPHFVEERDREKLTRYRAKAGHEVREIRDGEFIAVDL